MDQRFRRDDLWRSWSGSVVGIPAGGPYWVSLRAANGTAYATLPNYVLVGANVAGFGEGNAVDQVIGTSFSNNQTYFQGLSTIVGCPSAGAHRRTTSPPPTSLAHRISTIGSGSCGSTLLTGMVSFRAVLLTK